MCELAILKKNNVGKVELTEFAMERYRGQRTSLGIVVVNWTKDYEDERIFEYDTFRSTDPDTDEVASFLRETWDDANRFIVHGRLGTSGEMDNVGTHPIPIDCPKCDVEYVLHNGVIGRAGRNRFQQEKTGHSWNTRVDTEAIAHAFESVPSDIDEFNNVMEKRHYLERQPAFVLLGRKNIAIHASNGYYNVGPNGQVARTFRDIGDVEETGTTRFLLHAVPEAVA